MPTPGTTVVSKPPASPAAVSVPTLDDIVLSFEFDPTDGKTWCDMWDNHVIAWLIDPLGVEEPYPVVPGELPAASLLDTSPVLSPLWCLLRGNSNVLVTNMWRGSLDSFFTWLATNNGADRKLRGNFIEVSVVNIWREWEYRNPDKIWDGVVTPPA